MFTEEDLLMMSPEEADLARQANAAEQAGRDPTADAAAEGDNPPAEEDAPTSNEGQGAAEEEAPKEEQAEAPAEAAQAAQEEQQTEPQEEAAKTIAPPTYSVDTARIEALQSERKNIRAKLVEAESKYTAGDLSDEEINAARIELQEAIDTINGNIATIQTLDQANKQSIAAAQNAVLDVIRAQGKRAGIDYSTPTLMAQFNAVLDGLDADPANAGLTFAEMADKAHIAVLAINGKSAPAVQTKEELKPAASATPPKRETPVPPKTLRAMPSAERAHEGFEGGTVADRMFAGTAVDAEAAWDMLTPKQREAMLRG